MSPLRRDSRRSVTEQARGRSYQLDCFESQAEPNSQIEMTKVNGVDSDDLEPHKPSASRLDVAELVELVRCKRRETVLAYPRRPGKDGWMGPVPAKFLQGPSCIICAGGTFRANREGCPPLSTTARSTSRERPLWLSQAIMFLSIMQRDDPMGTAIPRLDNYEGVEIMVVARPLRGAEGMGAATVGKRPPEHDLYRRARPRSAEKGKTRDGKVPRSRPSTGIEAFSSVVFICSSCNAATRGGRRWPTGPKQKLMPAPSRRGDAPTGASVPTQASAGSGSMIKAPVIRCQVPTADRVPSGEPLNR